MNRELSSTQFNEGETQETSMHTLRKLNVLVIDDEPFILEYVRKVLQQAGYATFIAENGDQGLAMFEARNGEIDFVLTDIVMPDSIDGLEVSTRVHRLDPTVPVLFITGAIPQADPHHLSLFNVGIVLSKDFVSNQL